MKKILYVIALILLTSCGVSRFKQQNWLPQNTSTSSYFYKCLKESQQVSSSASFGANNNFASGSANTSAHTNDMLFTSCMRSNGYSLRPITSGERVKSILTFPLFVPFDIFDTLIGGQGYSDYY